MVRHRGNRRKSECYLSVILSLMVLAVVHRCNVSAQIDFETPHCGKRFRIVTHLARPFINLDPEKCVDQRCPPEAFGEDGGFTYNLLNDEILPILKRICRDAGKSDDIDFRWYLPPSGTNLASNAVKMACNGKFKDIRSVDQTSNNFTCPADWLYNGPSDFGSCGYIGDPSCRSEGPDMVAGAVHILRERLDMIDFSVPYLTVQQTVVKPRTEEPPDFMNVFKCFAFDLWLALLMEIIVVWFLILLIELPYNEGLSKETWFAPFYDSWFWAFGSSLDAGGPGKSPVTVAGRIFMMGHYFLMLLIVATYTGAFGPFLSSQADDIVKDFDSLAYGGKSVVVRGPSWDSEVEEPPFLGNHLGGNSEAAASRSTQFRMLQATMKTDGAANFQVWTTTSMDTYWEGQRIEPRVDLDPCLVTGAVLGAYDMVKCRSALTATYYPEATIYDAPSVFYELNRRRDSTGICELVTIGPQFSPTGFGLGFVKTAPVSLPFSRAIQELLRDGVIETYRERYRIRRQDSLCSEDFQDGALSMTIPKMFGLIVFTIIGILISCGQGAKWKIQDEEREAAYQAKQEAKEAAEAEEAAAKAAEEEEAAAAAAEAEAAENGDGGEGEGEEGSVRSGESVPVNLKRRQIITPKPGTIPKESLSERVQMMLPQADRLERILKRMKLPALPVKRKKDNAAELRRAVQEVEEKLKKQVEGVTQGVTRTLSGGPPRADGH